MENFCGIPPGTRFHENGSLRPEINDGVPDIGNLLAKNVHEPGARTQTLKINFPNPSTSLNFNPIQRRVNHQKFKQRHYTNPAPTVRDSERPMV